MAGNPFDRMRHMHQRANWIRWGAAALLCALPGPAAGQEAATGSTGPVRHLGLAEAIEEAVRSNADLSVARSRTAIAGADARAGASPLLPRLDVSSGWIRSNDPVFAFGSKLRQGIFGEPDFAVDLLNDPDPIEEWASSATLQWTIVSPQAWAGRSAAARSAEAADWAEVRTLEGTVLVTEIRYYEAQQGMARRLAAQAAEEAAASARDAFARREAEGLLTRAEVLQAEAEYQAAVAGRIDARRREADALRGLAVHLGWDPETRIRLTDTLVVGGEAADPAAPPGGVPQGGAAVDPAADPSARADLRALEREREAATAASRSARLGFLPSLEGFAGWTTRGDEPLSGDGEDWTAGLVLRWNVFSGFARTADVRRTDAARSIARTRYDEALRLARAEIAGARDAVAAARQSARAAAAADAAASLGRDLMRRRFEEGLATATDVLAAEARASVARSRAIDAETGRRMAEARLRFVTTQHASE